MSKENDLPQALQNLQEVYESEFFEAILDSSSEPPREIFLAEELIKRYPNLASGAPDLIEAAVDHLTSWGAEIEDFDTSIPGLEPFVELGDADQGMIDEIIEMYTYLFSLEGYEIVNFDVPTEFTKDSENEEWSGLVDAMEGFGFSNNEWVYGALIRDLDEQEEERENLSYLNPDQIFALESALLINWKAINATPELLREIRALVPRLREVYELNNFANNGDETATPEYAEKFLQSEKIFIRSLVASSSNAPEEYLRRCALDVEPFVRMELTSNPNSPTDLLIHLLGDEVSEVSKAAQIPLAKRPDVPAAVLEQLATSENQWVRKSVIDHPSSTSEIKALAALSN